MVIPMSDRYKVVDNDTGKENTFDNEDDAKDVQELLEEQGHDVDLIDTQNDGEPVDPEIVDHTEPTDSQDPAPDVLAQDPIDWLESQNSDFANTIKGTPAISKQGFRFIQQRFNITTKSDVVETFDDPLGVVVWAKAERPDGQTAEAHGEGWQFESGVDDNEFVRYADTRAKNRAISDLTSAGALAVSELGEQ